MSQIIDSLEWVFRLALIVVTAYYTTVLIVYGLRSALSGIRPGSPITDEWATALGREAHQAWSEATGQSDADDTWRAMPDWARAAWATAARAAANKDRGTR